jgi:hypothetical protein
VKALAKLPDCKRRLEQGLQKIGERQRTRERLFNLTLSEEQRLNKNIDKRRVILQ